MQKIFSLSCLIILSLPLGAQTADQGSASLAIVQRFIGPARMPVKDEIVSERDPLVIRNQADFELFCQGLPIREISKTKNPGPSRDPLVKVPRFDWDHLMMLVIFDAQTLSFPPQVPRVDRVAGQIIVTIRYRDNKDVIEAKELGIGSYTAVLIQQSNLPVLFTTQPGAPREGGSAQVKPWTGPLN